MNDNIDHLTHEEAEQNSSLSPRDLELVQHECELQQATSPEQYLV